MLRPVLALTALLTLSTAHAADLDLTITSDDIGPVTVTLHDVKPGPLPSVDVPGSEGHSIRLDLTFLDSTMEGQASYDLKMHITKRTPSGRRKVHEEVSDPTVRFRPDQEAVVGVGGQRQVPGSDPVEWESVNFFEVKARLRMDEPAP